MSHVTRPNPLDDRAALDAPDLELLPPTSLDASTGRERNRVERRLRALLRVADALSSALSPASFAEAILREAIAISGAASGRVGIVEEGRLRIFDLSSEAGDDGMIIHAVPLTTARPLVDAARSGRAVYLESPAEVEARYPDGLGQLGPRENHAVASLPLLIRGESSGAIGLHFAAARRFDEAERAFLAALSHHCAQALDRARLFEAEQIARDRAEVAANRAERLQRLTAGLASALTPTDVAVVAVREAIAALDADAGMLVHVGADDAVAKVLAHAGLDDATVIAWRRRQRTPEDLVERAARTGESVFIESAEDAAGSSLPRLASSSMGACAALPLVVEGRAIGALLIGFDGDRAFADDDRSLIQVIAQQSGQALERASLQEAAEAGRRRADFLAEVSERLARSLDYGMILDGIAEHAVPSIADWCLVTVVDENGVVDRVAVAHVDAAKAELAAEITALIARRDERTANRTYVLETDEPYLETDVSHLPVTRSGKPDGRRTVLERLEARSAIIVPLLAHGRSFGSIALVSAASERRYDADDLLLARDLARRAAGAVENAQLYADLRRLARSERARAAELEGVLQAMGEPVLVFDPDGRIRLANQAAVGYFGDAMIHDFAWVIGRFDDPARVAPVLGHPERQGPVELRMSKAETWVELTAYPVQVVDEAEDAGMEEIDPPDQIPSSTILVVRDVTAIRQAQRLREAFISVLSHELRTPITTIYGGTRVLAKSGLAESTRREVSEDITAEAERLHRLVEDLLVLTRAERGRIEIGGDPVLLQHLLPGVVRSEAARWPDNRFEIELAPTMPTVSAEETYVEQVLRNLVGNAAKYSTPGGLVEIKTEVLEDEVQVRILDEGPGFAPEERPRLFELFYRSPTTSSTSSGAGIGLFVCRALVEAMGGRIWAHPRPAGGAEFGFALPRFDDEEI